jgi:diguanylate cyclase (GGDEF)-like protein
VRKRAIVLAAVGATAVLAAGLWVVVAGGSEQADAQTVRVALYENPPKVYSAPDGTGTGMFPTILDAIADEAGWRIEYVPCEWEDCLAQVRSGDLDLVPDVAWSADRGEVLDFPAVSVANSWSQVYVRPGLTVTGLEDLDGSRVALLSGGIQEERFTELMDVSGQSFTPVPVRTLRDGYEAVASGAADAVVTNSFFAAWNGSEYQLKETPIVFLPSTLYVATGAGANGDLLATMDEYLGPWRADPDSVYFDALYGTVAAPPSFTVPRWLVVSVIVLVGGLLIALVVTMVLRAQVRRRTRDLQASEEKYRTLETRDPLTGLPNRALHAELLRGSVDEAADADASFSMLLVDLRDLAAINECIGQAKTQEVIREIASRLVATVGDDCPVARTGGGEFAVLVPEAAGVLDGLLAQRILDALQRPLAVDGQQVFVGACVGIASYPNDGPRADDVQRTAESALRLAKQAGPGSFRYSSADLTERARERIALSAELRDAIDRGEFVLHYQPQQHLATGDVIGLEALIRWNHPTRGLVLPGDFIPLAEASGIIVPLGQWVLGEACRQVREWRAAGLAPPPVAVNLSASQFSDEGLVPKVTAALSDSGIEAAAVELEITETSVMLDLELATRSLAQLSVLGVALAIDDFGTGYSSLAYLRSMPVTRLKIDMSCVRGIVDDPEDAAIVRAVVTLGHGLGLTVLAEGVETEAQRSMLRELGCDAIQGYLLARPLPAAEVDSWLTPRLPVPGR